jgi:kynurenine formamidase
MACFSAMSDVIRETAARCRNWGKWGESDERGTINYITPELIIRAARLIRRGAVFSLAIPFDSKGPQPGGHALRFNPIHRMTLTGSDYASGALSLPGGVGFSDDVVIMPTHCATQWDALSHCFVDGKMYNGFDAREISSLGARKNSIDKMARGIVGRGVLIDMPRFKGVPWLEPGYAITASDLAHAAERQNVTIGSGDVLLVRTGHLALCRDRKSWGDYAGGDAAGLSFHTADWIHAHEIAAVATDTWSMEVRPHEIAGALHPLHQIFLPQMGLPIGEIFDLEEFADDCAADGIYECFLAAPPLPITGAVGSPINPVAIK